MKRTYYTHHYEGTGNGPCEARGTVSEPVTARPGYLNLAGVRVSDAPCGLPRMAHEQGPLAHHTVTPRLVRIDAADLLRMRRPDAPAGRRIQEARPDVPGRPRRRPGGRGGTDDGSIEPRPNDVRVLVPRELLDRLGHRGSTELVTDHARRLLRSRSEHPWPLLVVSERDAMVEVGQPREALQLLRARPSQRARLSAARRSVAERLTAALLRAAQTDDLDARTRIVADAVQAAAVRLETAEARSFRPEPKPRPRGSVRVVTGGLPTLRPHR